MKLYNHGQLEQVNMLPYVITTNMTSSFDKNEAVKIEQLPPNENLETNLDEKGGFDVFKHTRVDIEEGQKPSGDRMDLGETRFIPGLQEVPKFDGHLGGDIFCFYKLCVDLPASFFNELGDTEVVTYR